MYQLNVARISDNGMASAKKRIVAASRRNRNNIMAASINSYVVAASTSARSVCAHQHIAQRTVWRSVARLAA